jgi:hypothetical protein
MSNLLMSGFFSFISSILDIMAAMTVGEGIMLSVTRHYSMKWQDDRRMINWKGLGGTQ